MKLRERRVRILTWVLTCLIGILGISIGGIFLAEKITVAMEFEKVPGFCKTIDCAALDIQIAEAEAAKRAAATGIIYLTFDDGPSDYTNRLLDVLKQYEIKATFFVTGRGADDSILRMFNEGHAIGLHTASHNYSYVYANTSNFWTDIAAIQMRVKNITGEESKLLRFPGGSSNTVSRLYDSGSRIMSRLVREATERGFIYFDWNVDSKDAGGAQTSAEVVSNVINSINRKGEFIVLQHDVKDFSVEAVENIIQYGVSNGYIFDKLSVGSFTAHHRLNN